MKQLVESSAVSSSSARTEIGVLGDFTVLYVISPG